MSSVLPGGGDSIIRQRKAKPVEAAVQAFDAFPKVVDEVKEQTTSGGSVSIIIFVVTFLLVAFEIRNYVSYEMRYTYEVDRDYNRKIRLNIDMTVAAKCESIGADIVDSTESATLATEDQITEEPVPFEMNREERIEWEVVSQMAEYIRREHHALHDVLWRDGFNQKAATAHLRSERRQVSQDDGRQVDGCRIHGYFRLSKIAGNLHIIAGKSMNMFPFGHGKLLLSLFSTSYLFVFFFNFKAHMQMVMPLAGGGIILGGAPAAVNFSHRIHHLSFGTPVPGMVHPLDGDEKIAEKENIMYQYLIKVIPTQVDTLHAKDSQTFQMAVTENERVIDHHEGSHGLAGIFIKYEFSPLAVKIEQYHMPYWQFIVRLCGIIGGVFATTGFIHFVIGFAVDCFLCHRNSAYAPIDSLDTLSTTKDKISNGHSN